MNPNSNLHELIASLSGPEKAYFKKLGQTWKGRNRMLLVFDLFVSTPELNDETARLSCNVASKAQWAVVKHELYERILAALRGFYRKKQLGLQLQNRLGNIVILIEKGLHNAALKQINSAQKVALKLDDFHALAGLLDHEVLVVKMIGGKEQSRTLTSLVRAMRRNNEILMADLQLKIFKEELFTILSEATKSRSRTHLQRIADIRNHSLISNKKPPSYFQGELKYYTIQGFVARLEGDLQAYQKTLRERLLVWERHPDKAKQEPMAFFVHLVSFLDVCLHNADVKAFENQNSSLNQPILFQGIDPVYRFQAEAQLELRYCINKPDFQNVISLEQKLKAQFEKYQSKMAFPFLFSLYYNLMVLLFLAEEYQKCLYWIRLIQGLEGARIRLDILSSSRVFRAVIFCQLGDLDHLEAEILSSSRFFVRRGPIFEFEKLILMNLRKITSNLNQNSSLQWNNLIKDIDTDKFSGLLGHKELLLWAKDKLEKLNGHH